MAPLAKPGHAIDVSLKDRWYILGMTGSGKTRFAMRLFDSLRAIYPAAAGYLLDSKGDDAFVGWPNVTEQDDAPGTVGPGILQVWRPANDVASAYDEWLEKILKARRPALVFIDELSSLSTNGGGTSYPNALAKLLKQGRSLGICVIILTQEAAYIPRQIKTQTTHLVRFRLQADEHAQRQAAALLGQTESHEPRDTFGFWYRRLNPAATEPIEYRDYQEFFGLAN